MVLYDPSEPEEYRTGKYTSDEPGVLTFTAFDRSREEYEARIAKLRESGMKPRSVSPDAMYEAGRRYAKRREQAFWDAFTGTGK